MPKHHDEKPHHKGEGVKLAGNPIDLINLLITDSSQKKWVVDQITNEGPKHKQVLTAILLNRAYKLVQTVEKSSGTKFISQEGVEIIKEKHEEEISLPIAMPLPGAGVDKKEIADAVAHAPEHESLAYIMALQVIEWTIKTIASVKK